MIAPDGWAEVDNMLRTSRQLPTFLDAIEFVRQVALIAEELDHHPDIDIRWRTVNLAVTSHDAGNTLTARDYRLAERVNGIAQ